MANVANRKSKCYSRNRYIFTALSFLGFAVIHSTRMTINVAIVAMVNINATFNDSVAVNSDECLLSDETVSNSSWFQENLKVHGGEFSWSPQLQGFILGSYWYGYMITPILGGRMSEIFSGKWVFGIGVFITSLLTMLTPVAARYSVTALIITRTISGLTVGFAVAPIQTMVGYWFDDSERGLLTSIIYSGIKLGIMFGLAASGALCESDLFGGWPSAFYVIGFIGCVWFIFWAIFVSNSSRPRYTPDIVSDEVLNMKKKVPPVPWNKMLSSGPFWSIIFMDFGIDWYFDICAIVLPTYLGTILHINMTDIGLFSSLSHIPALFFCIIAGITSDALINKNILGRVTVRKLCSAVTGFGSALGLLGVVLAECDVSLSITFLTISKLFNGFIINGYIVGIVELSAKFAGTITGIAYTLSSLTGFLVPMMVGYLTEEKQTLKQWRIIFGISISITCLCTLLFVLLYTTENLDFTKERKERSKIQDKITTTDCNECETFI